MSDSEEDSVPQLSAHTLAALREFYAEQQQQHPDPSGEDRSSGGMIEENWRLSQFWYSEETARRLAEEAVAAAGHGGRVACVCTPSVYRRLRALRGAHVSARVFEFDRRFAVYGDDFVFYDYNRPLDLPADVAARSFDLVIADPPHLSEDCLRKTAETVKHLARGKVLLCTGAVMEAAAARLLGVKACSFVPTHSRALGNEFRCYANYDSGLDQRI